MLFEGSQFLVPRENTNLEMGAGNDHRFNYYKQNSSPLFPPSVDADSFTLNNQNDQPGLLPSSSSLLSTSVKSLLPPSSSFATSLEDNPPVASTKSIAVSIILAEPTLYISGFTHREQLEHPPTLLRGSLVLKVSKSCKIRSVNLVFKGVMRTEWPEGIPPSNTQYFEQSDIHEHVWPFFNANFPMAETSSGANMVRFLREESITPTSSMTTLSTATTTETTTTIATAILDENTPAETTSNFNILLDVMSSRDKKSINDNSNKESLGSHYSFKGLADRFRRATSPSPSFRSSSRSSLEQIINDDNENNDKNERADNTTTNFLSPEISLQSDSKYEKYLYSQSEHTEKDVHSKGYRNFVPGEYVYNFELPIMPTYVETCNCPFGSVKYYLEAKIERSGAFSTNLNGRKEVEIVRNPSDESLEFSAPITISKNWEDQLYYEIVILGKTCPIGASIPISIKMVPLDKVKCHRIKIVLTEHCEYYTKDKKVHRIEPTRKFTLYEKRADSTLGDSLLGELEGIEELMDFGATELELNVEIPETNIRGTKLRPNLTDEYLTVNHWIKIIMRLSKKDLEDSTGQKRKHFEISIDSPFHLLDKRCTNSNILLPEYPTSFTLLGGNSPTDSANLEFRPIHLLHKPSLAPPPFEADTSPPMDIDGITNFENPPDYDSIITTGLGSYRKRYKYFKHHLEQQEKMNHYDPGFSNIISAFPKTNQEQFGAFDSVGKNKISLLSSSATGVGIATPRFSRGIPPRKFSNGDVLKRTLSNSLDPELASPMAGSTPPLFTDALLSSVIPSSSPSSSSPLISSHLLPLPEISAETIITPSWANWGAGANNDISATHLSSTPGIIKSPSSTNIKMGYGRNRSIVSFNENDNGLNAIFRNNKKQNSGTGEDTDIINPNEHPELEMQDYFVDLNTTASDASKLKSSNPPMNPLIRYHSFDLADSGAQFISTDSRRRSSVSISHVGAVRRGSIINIHHVDPDFNDSDSEDEHHLPQEGKGKYYQGEPLNPEHRDSIEFSALGQGSESLSTALTTHPEEEGSSGSMGGNSTFSIFNNLSDTSFGSDCDSRQSEDNYGDIGLGSLNING